MSPRPWREGSGMPRIGQCPLQWKEKLHIQALPHCLPLLTCSHCLLGSSFWLRCLINPHLQPPIQCSWTRQSLPTRSSRSREGRTQKRHIYHHGMLGLRDREASGHVEEGRSWDLLEKVRPECHTRSSLLPDQGPRPLQAMLWPPSACSPDSQHPHVLLAFQLKESWHNPAPQKVFASSYPTMRVQRRVYGIETHTLIQPRVHNRFPFKSSELHWFLLHLGYYYPHPLLGLKALLHCPTYSSGSTL